MSLWDYEEDKMFALISKIDDLWNEEGRDRMRPYLASWRPDPLHPEQAMRVESPVDENGLNDCHKCLLDLYPLEARNPGNERRLIRKAHEDVLEIIRHLRLRGLFQEEGDPLREIEQELKELYDIAKEHAVQAGPLGYIRDDPDPAQGRSPG